MRTAEIRRRFLEYFGERGHTVVPSASMLLDDPDLLFVNAGMVPFKPYFLGEQAPPYDRAVSVQKCLRTLDIEEVGKTTRHGTFFQMNGNFSFGDYFKEGAIELAWDLVTRAQSDGGFGFDPARLWVTVYHDDDEAIGLWRRIAGVPDERIVRRGMADNYWSMGVPGPCGPCSEIYWDRGPEHGPDGGPDADEDRYLEFWNLVFMQYVRGPGTGKDDFPILGPLPQRNIDTGMGLERIAYLLQGVANLYEIDEVRPVLDRAADLAGVQYGADPGNDVRLRVVADHVRSALMLVGEGVTPGNEARGYVVRRLVRRVVRSMRLLGVDEPVLPALLPESRKVMQASYPELATDFARISAVVYGEEEAFRQTLRTGTQMFELAAAQTKQTGSTQLSGDRAFTLHDTYGFPVDLTLEMAAEQGLTVDEEGFRALMAEQRQRAKSDASAKRGGRRDLSAYRELAHGLGTAVAFTGYDEVVSEATVRGLLAGSGTAAAVGEGEQVELVLDRTPFYAEGGGQLADQGVVEVDGGRFEVTDVQSPVDGLIVHHGRVVSGEVRLGGTGRALVDVDRRRSISRSHTATHMVHKAFREALGETATQAGSENAPGRFRFDFAAAGAVPPSVLADVEQRVNALVLDDLAVSAEVMSLDDARRSGAVALFGERYGEQVRVVSVGDWARELCGGTHTHRSSQLGVVTLLGESSIGAGVRRVEALVGADAYRYLAREHVLVSRLAETLKTRPADLPDRVAAIVAALKAAEKELERNRLSALLGSAETVARAARDVDGVRVAGHRAPEGTGPGDLRRLAVDVRGRLPAAHPAVATLVGAAGGKPAVVVAVNEAGRARGLSAADLVGAAVGVLGGRGGGTPELAQGGGADAARLDDALRAVEEAVARHVVP